MTDANLNPDLDQTQFGSEGWLYNPNKPSSVPIDLTLPKKIVWWQTKNGKIILIIGALVLMSSLMAIANSIRRTNQIAAQPENSDLLVPSVLDLGPLGLKTQDLRDQLKLADPTKELDPFPPVRLDLRLDVAGN